jgi:hypothetical protein
MNGALKGAARMRPKTAHERKLLIETLHHLVEGFARALGAPPSLDSNLLRPRFILMN